MAGKAGMVKNTHFPKQGNMGVFTVREGLPPCRQGWSMKNVMLLITCPFFQLFEKRIKTDVQSIQHLQEGA